MHPPAGPGLVLIDVPIDIQLETVSAFAYPQRPIIVGYKPSTQGMPFRSKKALAAIDEAQRPIICCGGGVVLAAHRDELHCLCQNSGIPVALP